MDSDNENYAYCGLAIVEPYETTTTVKQDGGTTRHEMTYRNNTYNKQSDSYQRVTAKESYSSGDYSYRGKTGYKNELQKSSTVRVGDKTGYTEYYKQEKVTRVDYGGGSSSYGSYGGKKGGHNSYGGGGSKKYLK